MSDTFRQAVEKILQEAVGEKYVRDYLTKSILSAHNAELDRIAEELPWANLHIYKQPYKKEAHGLGKADQRKSDQAYIQAQKGS